MPLITPPPRAELPEEAYYDLGDIAVLRVWRWLGRWWGRWREKARQDPSGAGSSDALSVASSSNSR